MKHLLSTITLLSTLAGAASAAPYVLPSPQTGALTPYDWQPVYAIEGLYSIAQDSDKPDTYGVRGSFNLYNSGTGTFRHQFNINVAAAWGSDDVTYPDGYKEDLDLFILPVTAGYNLNIALTDKFMLYLGAKAGYAWSHRKYSGEGYSDSESKGGFTYSAGGGFKYQFSQSVYAHVSYEFGRSYLEYDDDGRDFIYGAHSIYLGVGCQF